MVTREGKENHQRSLRTFTRRTFLNNLFRTDGKPLEERKSREEFLGGGRECFGKRAGEAS